MIIFFILNAIMNSESHDTGMNVFYFDCSKEEPVAPFMMLGNQNNLSMLCSGLK